MASTIFTRWWIRPTITSSAELDYGRVADVRVRSTKDQAIEVARTVLKYEQAAISITPSETILLAREYLKALRLRESM